MQADPKRSNSEPAAKRRAARARDIKVPVLPEEAALIKEQAGRVGMTVAAYLRAVGQGYEPRAVVDRDQVDAMLRVNGDLGRLGGLLKLWLTDDAKLAAFDSGQVRQAVMAALRRIDETQGDLRQVIGRALRNRGEP